MEQTYEVTLHYEGQYTDSGYAEHYEEKHLKARELMSLFDTFEEGDGDEDGCYSVSVVLVRDEKNNVLYTSRKFDKEHTMILGGYRKGDRQSLLRANQEAMKREQVALMTRFANECNISPEPVVRVKEMPKSKW